MSLFADYQNNKRLIILLLVFTFLLKVSLGVYFSYLGDCNKPENSIGYLAKETGDTFSYIGSVENLVTQGEYYFWNGERKVYAGRMPFYGAPYFVFRLFFDKPLASDLFVLLQIFFDALATIYFARLCRDVLKHEAGFWIGYALYLLSFNFFENALLLSTESLSYSFIVLFFYAFHRWWSGENKSAVWAANIFLSLILVLKPYFAPVYLFFLAVYYYRENLLSIGQYKTFFQRSVLLSLPLLLLLAPWFFRNLLFHGQPVVTQESVTAGYNYTKADFAFRRFSGAWGGDPTYWDANSAACYFKVDPPFPCTFSYPSYILTEGYTLQDVEDVRADYLAYQKNPSPELEETVVNEFDRLTAIYKSERPFMFYFGSGLMRLKTMLWHTNNYNLPIYPGNPCFKSYQLIFKVIQSIIYHLSLTLGLAGIIWLTIKNKISLIFIFVPVSIALFIGFYGQFAEARYFSHAYPVMLLALAAVSFLIYSRVKDLLKSNLNLLN
jgi:hypothetical protein